MNRILGLDVGKKWLDVCLYKQATKPLYARFTNDSIGHKALLAYLNEVSVSFIVCEPTGGYERAVCQKLNDKHIAIHQVETYKFSAFSKSMDKCKTDKHDAFKLAYYGYERNLQPNYNYQVEKDKLKRQQQRREDLVVILGNEKKRLHNSQSGIDRESIEKLMIFLEKEIKNIDKQLAKAIDASKPLKEKTSILETIPGIGLCLATKLVTALPELGDASYSSNQLSALVGIAPYPNDSGKKTGRRSISGGRKIPPDALYMAVLTGRKGLVYLKKIYQRLVDKSKPKKVAIVACMRKLLEMAHKLMQNKKNFVNQPKIN